MKTVLKKYYFVSGFLDKLFDFITVFCIVFTVTFDQFNRGKSDGLSRFDSISILIPSDTIFADSSNFVLVYPSILSYYILILNNHLYFY